MRKRPWQVQIIADEMVMLLAVSRAYRDKLVDVVTANSAGQALAQMDIFSFDLFLLDLDLKGCCSFSLLKVMTERFPRIPVVLMTTRNVESKVLLERIEAVRSAGCWHLLEKPFDDMRLASFIDRAVQTRSMAVSGSGQCDVVDEHEKRRCARFSRFEQINMSLPVTPAESCQSVSFLATLMDISVGGLGLTTNKQVTVSQMIHFDEKFMHQSGVIVWSQAQDEQTCRAGIEFI